MVPDEGTPVAVLSTEVVVIVVVPPPPPDFGRYLIPLDGQLPGVIASVLTKDPSMMDPFTYGLLDQGSQKRVDRIDCVYVGGIDTHVVVIVDLEERPGVAFQADFEAICRPEDIDDIRTGVCLCA